MSTAEDGKVDFKDRALPEVSWEGVEYTAKGFPSRSFDTIVDVPTVSHTSIHSDYVLILYLIPQSVQHNASLWADIFVTSSGQSPNPSSSTYSPDTLHVRKLLTRYFPLRKTRPVKNLLAGKKQTEEEKETERLALEQYEKEKREAPIISYWHPNVSLQLVSGSGVVPYGGLPDTIKERE